MQYTNITQTLGPEIAVAEKEAFGHPDWAISTFSIHKLGIRPYKYQHMLYKNLMKQKKIILTKSRQIGISTAIEIIALWAATTNAFPSGIFKNTKIGIVSKSDKQSKKVLLDIKKIMAMADSRNSNTEFAMKLDDSKYAPNNMYELSFKNKCFIKCFPPTDSIRGESLDIVFVDEGAFVEDDIFYDSIEPTTSKSDGKIIIASTPNGQKGFFFELFDPWDKYKTHNYNRYWFYWKQCEDVIQRKIIKSKFYEAREKGTLKNFDQEYNAKFTVDEEAFFDSTDVNNAVDHNMSMELEWKKSPCSLSIDYGITKAATVLTVKTKVNKIIRTLFQWAGFDFDENLLMDKSFEHSIPNMLERYSIQDIYVDDCPQGNRTNKEMENEGYPVKRIYFSSGQGGMGTKHKMYYGYRGALKKGLIKFPEIKELMIEMKALMEVRMKVTTSIGKPKNGTDDRIDGEVMASIPFIESQGDFYAEIVEPDKKQRINAWNRARYDEDVEELVAEQLKTKVRVV